MTKQTNLKKLRQVIIKEIPEIVELKFGCEVIYKEDGENKDKHYICLGSTGMMTDIHQGCYGYYDFKEKDKKTGDESLSLIHHRWHTGYKMKIIGRKITLADVLRVVKKIYPNRIYETYATVEWWDLSKNDLNLQSKPTIDFLSKIILKGDEK